MQTTRPTILAFPRGVLSRIVLGVLLLSVVTAALARPGGEGQASGTWTVDGETIELRLARAFREPDPFGKGTNPCVLVSNEPVPDDAVPDDDDGVAELLDRMRSGTLRALQVCFDATGTKLRNVNDVFTFHPAVSPGRFALQGFHRFTSQPTEGRIAGKLQGSGATSSGGAWSDAVELSVDMPQE